ncbi:25416_t:CDS:10, partial [Dentiscutata erythropus]
MLISINISILGALPDKLIDDLVLPSKEPVGMRLLKSMGWREGQGIGPRVKRKKRDYDDVDNEENEDQIFSTLFAPKNTSIVSFEQKANNYGLGYNPFENAPEFVFQSATSKGDGYLRKDKPKSSFPIRGTSMTDFNTSLIDDDDDDIIIMGSRKYSKMSNLSTESQMKKSSFHDNRSCHDGTQPLRGFMLARKPLPIDKWFSPPDLPPEYVPFHEFDSQTQNTQDTSKKNIKQKQTTLAIVAEQRGSLLGETPLNAPARSVFDYVSRKDKERLDSIVRPVIDTSGDKNVNKPKIPKIENDVALAALKGFIPFEDNKEKQARYKKYLEVHAELIAPELLRKPEELTADEFSKELDEFSKAARIFRPMSKMIASRFTSSSSPAEEFKQPVPGLRAGAGNDSDIPSDKKKDTDQLDSESTAEAAAKMNMFGQLTRSKSVFYPSKLLCKRFNVANPHPEHAQNSSSGRTQKGQKEALSRETMNDILNKQDAQNFPGFSTTQKGQKEELSRETMNDSLNKQDAQNFPGFSTTQKGQEEELSRETMNDILNKQDAQNFPGFSTTVPTVRPAMELFKSIFGDSGSEDDDDGDAPKHKKPPNLEIIEILDNVDDDGDAPKHKKPPNLEILEILDNVDEDNNETQNKTDETRNKIDLINPSVPSITFQRTTAQASSSKTINQSSSSQSKNTSINRTRNRPRASDL